MTMQEFARSFLCAVLAVALALVVLTFGAPAHAQLGDLRYPDHAQLGEHDANVVESVRTVTIAVRVAKADGSPAAGAVVVSAAGGQGVTNAEGVAHLDVTLSSEADSVHVTAAATESGATSTGSVRVAIDADQIDAGVITLAEGGE